MNSRNEDSRCKGVTKRGEPCRAAATAGGLCFFHANPSKASELGRIGGRSKGRAATETVDPLPVLNNAIAVRDTLARLIVDVHAGTVQPKVAVSLAPLLTLQLRAIEAASKLVKLRAETPLENMNIDDMSIPQLQEHLRNLDAEEEAMKAEELAHCLELSKSLLEIA
jgi:hypothetical protein